MEHELKVYYRLQQAMFLVAISTYIASYLPIAFQLQSYLLFLSIGVAGYWAYLAVWTARKEGFYSIQCFLYAGLPIIIMLAAFKKIIF